MRTKHINLSRRLLSGTLALALGASAAAGCGSTETAAVDQAATAIGGKEMLLGLKGQTVVSTGKRFEVGQTAVWTAAPVQLPDFNATDSYDVSAERVKVAWKRPGFFGNLMYSEIVDKDIGYFDGIDNGFAQMPQSSMLSARVAAVKKHERLLNPHILLQRALQKPETVTTMPDVVEGGVTLRVVALADAFQPIKLLINKDTGLVDRVETVEDDPMRGDIVIKVALSDYRDVNGIKVPHKLTLKSDDVLVLDETRSSVQVNPTLDAAQFAVPTALKTTASASELARGEAISEYIHRFAAFGVTADFNQASNVQVASVGTGIYHYTGATAHTLAIEMANEIIVAEAPTDDERSKAVIAQIKKSIPNKPIKWVINTHHHDDHSGGIRTYVAEGATVVTAQINEAYFTQLFARPHTVRPDSLQMKPTAAKFQSVGTTPFEISDGTRKVRIYPMAASHADKMLIVYVEDAKLLFAADVFSPGFFPANMPIVGPFAQGAKDLYNTITTLSLSVNTLVGAHGFGTAPFAALRVNAGF